VKSLARGVGKSIPDGWLPSVFIHRALNLIGSGSAAPEEVGRKSKGSRAGQLSECNLREAGTSQGSGGSGGGSRYESATCEIFHSVELIIDA
jgi:hypothetical protein